MHMYDMYATKQSVLKMYVLFLEINIEMYNLFRSNSCIHRINQNMYWYYHNTKTLISYKLNEGTGVAMEALPIGLPSAAAVKILLAHMLLYLLIFNFQQF